MAVVTKMDLADAVEFDFAAVYRNIHAVRPGMRIMSVFSKTGDGVASYLDFLGEALEEYRGVTGTRAATIDRAG